MAPHERWPLLKRFRDWMIERQGVAAGTMEGYQRYVVDFIAAYGVDPSSYNATSVRDFMVRRCAGHKVATAQGIASAMRAFLRFLAATGQCSEGLIHAVPRFASYQLASTPRFLEPEDLEKVIDAVSDQDAVGARDRAVVLLLARLGLRASEVAALSFDAIDWQNGRIAVCGKGGRQHWLPLPQQVGDAIVTYLRRGRPPLPVPQVFITALAPAAPDDSARRIRCRGQGASSSRGQGASPRCPPAAPLGGHRHVAQRGVPGRHRQCSETPRSANHRALRQDRLRPAGRDRPAVAGDDGMLSDHVDRYLALRRTLGYKLHNAGRNLQAFAAFAGDKGDTHIRAATAVQWAAQASTPHARAVRLHDVVLLARFLFAEDASHEIPPAHHFHVRMVRQPPYIYTPTEIGQLLAAARRLPCSYALRRSVYATLIGLIAATGLRVSEALDLCFDDLLPSSVLHIRRTKFAKSRLVPLHPTTVEALTEYLQERQRLAIADDHLFVSTAHRRIPTPTASGTFQRVVRLAGIAPGRRRRPRMVDLRHTFATRSLQRCAVRRESVARHLVALSTYLGHTDVVHTYWYLEATPDLMANIATTGENFVSGRSA